MPLPSRAVGSGREKEKTEAGSQKWFIAAATSAKQETMDLRLSDWGTLGCGCNRRATLTLSPNLDAER